MNLLLLNQNNIWQVHATYVFKTGKLHICLYTVGSVGWQTPNSAQRLLWKEEEEDGVMAGTLGSPAVPDQVFCL